MITIVAAGEVTDYADGSAKANLIKTNLANTAKVDVSAITLKVTAARYPLATHVSCALPPRISRALMFMHGLATNPPAASIV